MNDENKRDEGVKSGQMPVRAEAAGASPGPQKEDVAHKALSDALNVSFRFLKIGMVILIVIYLMQGWFYVPRDRVAIKLSFGRPVEVNLRRGRGTGFVMDSESGWHFAWPWQEIVWLSLEQQTLDLDTEFARGGRIPSERRRQVARGSLSLHEDNYLLTGDVNIIHIGLRARYRIRSDQQGAFDYAFRFLSHDEEPEDELKHMVTPEDMLQRIVIRAATEIVSNWEVLEVRRKRRVLELDTDEGPAYMRLSLYEEIENRTQKYLRAFEEVNGFSIGIDLVAIEPIGDPDVPAEVRPHFDMALDAESQKDTLIQEARRDATGIVQAATGDRAEIIARAEAYKTRVVSSAEADAQMLEKLIPIYEDSPEKASILREWHYGRMVNELLGPARGSFVLHGESETTGRELWLELAPQRTRREDD